MSLQWETIASSIRELWPGRYNRILAEALGVPRATVKAYLPLIQLQTQRLPFYCLIAGELGDGDAPRKRAILNGRHDRLC